MKKEIKDIVADYLEKNPDLNFTAIADLIIEDGAIDKAHRTIRRYAKEVQDEIDVAKTTTRPVKTFKITEDMILPSTPAETEATIQAVESSVADVPVYDEQCIPEPVEAAVEEGDNVEEDALDILYRRDSLIHDKFTAVDGVYKFTHQKTNFEIDIRLADLVFCAYTRKGFNMTKHQIVSKITIELDAFNALANRLELSKESQPFSPYTEEYFDGEEQYNVIKTCSGELLEMGTEDDTLVVEATVRETKKQHALYVNKSLLFDRFLDILGERTKDLQLAKIDVAKLDTTVTPMNVVITDLHLGLKTKEFNMETAVGKLSEILGIIKETRKEGQGVIVTFLGDLMHSISGVQHPDMWQRIEEGAWGANLMIDVFEVLAGFLSEIEGLTKVYAVGGNHDRIIPDKSYESESQGSKLVFYMLERALQVDVIYQDHTNVFDMGNIRFICVHGDQGLDRKPAQEIAWMKGSQDKYNVILEGHMHTFFVPKNDVSATFMKLHCPSFCPQDQYAERLGLESLSGFIIIQERNGLPKFSVEPLNYI